MSELIDPILVTVTDADRQEHEFHVGKMPALVAREVLAKYAGSAIPKAGEYQASHEAATKMLRYVAKEIDGQMVPLKTEALINNHVPDGEALIRLEIACLRRSTSFFPLAGSQNLMASLLDKLEAIAPKIMSTLMDSLQQSSAQDSPASQTSKPQ